MNERKQRREKKIRSGTQKRLKKNEYKRKENGKYMRGDREVVTRDTQRKREKDKKNRRMMLGSEVKGKERRGGYERDGTEG